MATKGRFGSNSKSTIKRSNSAKGVQRGSTSRTKARPASTATRGGRTGRKTGAVGVPVGEF
jgi:hypothetical protein